MNPTISTTEPRRATSVSRSAAGTPTSGRSSRWRRGVEAGAAEDVAIGDVDGGAEPAWTRHDFSRRQRGMFDKFVARDMDGDGDVDFAGTRGNRGPYDGVFWLEQVRSAEPRPAFERARAAESPEVPLPGAGAGH
jgi:hypothetical protein